MKPATAARRLEPLLVTRLWALQLAFEARLDAALASSGLGLTSAGFRLVGELMNAPAGLKQRELAERLGVKAPTISVAVSRLEAAGVVERVEDPVDPRAWRITLTANAPITPGVDVLEQLERALLTGLSAKERRTFGEVISRLTTQLRGATE